MINRLWLRLQKNNLIYKIISVVVAVVLWLYVTKPFGLILP